MVSYSTAVGPILTISKCVGLFPYRLPSGQQLPKSQRLLSLSVNFISIGLGIIMLYDDWSKKLWMKMEFFRFLRRTFSLLFVLAVTTHIYWQIRHPRKMESILKKLHSSMIFLGSKHFTCYNIAIVVFGLLSYGFVLPGYLFSRGNAVFDVVGGLIIPQVHHILLLAQFFALMEVIHGHLLRLNRLTLSATDLEKCTRIHSELCALTKEVNQVYNVELLMSFVSWLASLITQWFQLHEAIAKGKQPHAGFLIMLPWIFGFRCVQMWSLCYISYEVHYQSDCFSDALCCAMRKKYPPSYSKKLTLYLSRRPSVTVTGFGLFSINTSILATILGTTMTYFIVLVQLN